MSTLPTAVMRPEDAHGILREVLRRPEPNLLAAGGGSRLDTIRERGNVTSDELDPRPLKREPAEEEM
ncbi:MAG: hypothetical protein ACE5JM_00620 [Armatimonadota bacterium]